MPWPQDAYVGQKVVCVDDASGAGRWVEGEEIYIGSEYTIKWIWVDIDNYVVFDLIEVKRNQSYYDHKIGYAAFRFRPVQTKSTETGMAILRKLQDPVNHKVLEGA